MSTSHPLAIVGHRGMVPRHLPRAAKITKEDNQSSCSQYAARAGPC
jgi:hypothetical protein